jgi:hypothetical protein
MPHIKIAINTYITSSYSTLSRKQTIKSKYYANKGIILAISITIAPSRASNITYSFYL